ncbi:MAG: hypothetical protein ACRD5F_07585 [Candidatus Acidiferrales bacterium]
MLASQLYSVQPNDAATLAGVALVLAAAALLACYFPARRATPHQPHHCSALRMTQGACYAAG